MFFDPTEIETMKEQHEQLAKEKSTSGGLNKWREQAWGVTFVSMLRSPSKSKEGDGSKSVASTASTSSVGKGLAVVNGPPEGLSGLTSLSQVTSQGFIQREGVRNLLFPDYKPSEGSITADATGADALPNGTSSEDHKAGLVGSKRRAVEIYDETATANGPTSSNATAASGVTDAQASEDAEPDDALSSETGAAVAEASPEASASALPNGPTGKLANGESASENAEEGTDEKGESLAPAGSAEPGTETCEDGAAEGKDKKKKKVRGIIVGDFMISLFGAAAMTIGCAVVFFVVNKSRQHGRRKLSQAAMMRCGGGRKPWNVGELVGEDEEEFETCVRHDSLEEKDDNGRGSKAWLEAPGLPGFLKFRSTD